MCMITYLPPFVHVPEMGILNGGTYNDDGHGWAIAAETGLMLTGHYMELDTALETFVATREAFPHAPALFHSRFATHGLTNLRNVHPFYVGNKDTVVAHNGVLPQVFHPGKNDKRSDTRIMADEWLWDQTKGMWTRSERRRIGGLIGTNNKLAILSVSPRFEKPKGFLVNANQGTWHRGAWFSNHDYEGWGRVRGISSGWHYWGSDDEKADTADTGNRLYDRDKQCQFCWSIGTVDYVSNVCHFCLTCQDCDAMIDDCLCFTPKSAVKAAESDDDGTAEVLSHKDRLGAALAILKEDDDARRIDAQEIVKGFLS